MKKIAYVFILISLTILSSCGERQEKAPSTAETVNVAAPSFATLEDRVLYSRALATVIWGLPAVNFELLHESLKNANASFNQIVYWSGLINTRNQTLTPNPDVIYVNPLYDTRNGPVVLEIPPAEGASSLTGSLDDAWQTAIEDIGPAGVDKGKGGKYLILPPDFKGQVPKGYIPMPSSTFTGFAILRSNLTDGSKKDLARAVDYGKKVRMYPFAQAANPSQTVFVDLLEVPFSNVIPYDIHFFELLDAFVQREPWLTRDKAMIDQLAAIGIKKGKSFNPDAHTREILNAAIKDAHTLIDQKYEAIFKPPFYEGTNWALPASEDVVKSIMSNYQVPDIYPVEERAISYSMAYFSAKHLGTGQFYLMTIKDKNGEPFDGAKQYHLHLPANVPVKLYWSVTAYDRETHALIKDMKYASRASTTPGLLKNEDGSVDLYFGSTAPAGKESNWIPTDAQGKFELLARFYGPEKAFFDKAWKMGDVEEIK